MISVTVTKQLLTLMRNLNVGFAMNTKVVAEISQDIATEIVSLVTAVMGVADARTEITQYGFNFGPAVVERLCSDDKKGWEGSGRSQPLGFILQ